MQNFCAVVFPLIALLVSPPLFALFVPTWLALLLTAVVALNPLTLLLLADGLKIRPDGQNAPHYTSPESPIFPQELPKKGPAKPKVIWDMRND